MTSWIKYGLVGALILVASFWGGSVRAAQMPLGQDTAVPGQLTAQVAVLPTDTHLLPLGALPSVVAGRGT
ncbi:hypothetical protein ACK3ZC_18550 [Aeromonas caviae]